MPGLRSSAGNNGRNDDGSEFNGTANNMTSTTTYEEIMGIHKPGAEQPAGGGAHALSSRLTAFRDWVSEEARILVHPAVCVVNGEATDGTKNAPVLLFGPPPGSQAAANTAKGRVGIVDGTADRALYERTMGCQVRTAREIKQDEVLMTVPRPAFVTPDLVASSDAGRALLACCSSSAGEGEIGFWDAFENTTICEQRFSQKIQRNSGTQLLVKILQERKRSETAFNRGIQEVTTAGDITEKQSSYTLAAPGVLSSRAPILAFLIHQRFSSDPRPPVVSESAETIREFLKIVEQDGKANALTAARRIKPHEGTPATFGPYARTLPSSVSLPTCWKRNEIALLAGCVPGMSAMQDIAATTMQLASEFIALIDAGILNRFPTTFPRGLITWERWVWAAAVFTSRVLPVSCYLNKGEKNAASHLLGNGEEFQSPGEIWDELGVMVPLLDMMNHESDTHQVKWEPAVPAKDEYSDDIVMVSSDEEPHPPSAILHKKVKKGQQIYLNYGAEKSNEFLILQYGFAQMYNKSDEARLGWGLTDAVGGVPRPSDYTPSFEDDVESAQTVDNKCLVYESTDSGAVNDWWSDERLALLEHEMFSASTSSHIMSKLKMGKKITGAAHNDGTYHPHLLTVSLIGTAPVAEISDHKSKAKLENDVKAVFAVTKRHQHVLRAYLTFIFTRKLEKLLEILNNGLKDHFGSLQLWTKASQNGLHYKAKETETEESNSIGWQTFFDEHAYSGTMEVEKRYYAMSPDSCVLTLYDGQLQSLHSSLDGLSTWEKYEHGVLEQLKDLGFSVETADNVEEFTGHKGQNGTTNNAVTDQGDPNNVVTTNQGELSNAVTNQGESKQGKKRNDDGKKKEEGGKSSPSKNRRRNRKRNNSAVVNSFADRPPAIKLHIGNLAYSTTPSDLYDYFSNMFGRDNVLECHIPTERETGKSRGFGFVTLPENIAKNALHSGRKHEVSGRLLKIAESNSAGSGKPNRVAPPPAPAPGDRCGTCGYRPKYCVCPAPSLHGHPGGGGPMEGDFGRDDYYGAGSAGRHRGDRHSRSGSPYHGGRRERDDHYGRDPHRDDRFSHYDRSRSPSNSGGRDRDRSRRDRKSRDRSKDRSRERSRDSRSGGRHGPSRRSLDHKSSRGSSRYSRSRSHSPSYLGNSRRDRKNTDSATNKERNEDKGSSLSRSPSFSRPNAAPESGGKNRESRKQRRSRSRSRERSRKSKKKKRRSRSRSPSPAVAKK
jgi:hypothetical protein